jgi:predicted component of type VI protein secretion system
MNAKLLIVLGKAIKRKVALQLPAVLGRSRQADITVTHPLISRRHCEISENDGLLMVRDLASLNGTMVGGRRIESAPLLPDAEFTIGPLTFRVLYEYYGDLESVPDTRFVAETAGTAEAFTAGSAFAGVAAAPKAEVDETLPTGPADESHYGELAIRDLMAMADADPEEIFPAAPASSPRAPRDSAASSPWPPVAIDKLPTVPLGSALDDPLEVDSSLQSGAHAKESPWGAELPAVEKPWQAPKPSATTGQAASAGAGPPAPPETPPEGTLAEEVVQPPVKKKPPPKNPPPANPPKRPTYGEEIDPEFGSFLEGLE